MEPTTGLILRRITQTELSVSAHKLATVILDAIAWKEGFNGLSRGMPTFHFSRLRRTGDRVAFKARVDDPARFRRSNDVGAHLGLTPRRYHSGEANGALHRSPQWTAIRAWGVRIAQRCNLKKAKIAVAGRLAFALATGHATKVMQQYGASTASSEIPELLRDISRRPNAEATGAIQHAMAALECVSREVGGMTEALGAAFRRPDLPPPLGQPIEKLWGSTLQQGRHALERRQPKLEEAEFVVTTASAVSRYPMLRRVDNLIRQNDWLSGKRPA